jgi:signal peptidase II
LRLIKNSWIAFSLPITWILLKVITIAILIWIFYYYFKHEKIKKGNIINIAYWLILWGARWNAIERILYSEVTDFLRIKYFAIFNFGDIFINIWVLLLLYLYLCKKWANKI